MARLHPINKTLNKLLTYERLSMIAQEVAIQSAIAATTGGMASAIARGVRGLSVVRKAATAIKSTRRGFQIESVATAIANVTANSIVSFGKGAATGESYSTIFTNILLSSAKGGYAAVVELSQVAAAAINEWGRTAPPQIKAKAETNAQRSSLDGKISFFGKHLWDTEPEIRKWYVAARGCAAQAVAVTSAIKELEKLDRETFRTLFVQGFVTERGGPQPTKVIGTDGKPLTVRGLEPASGISYWAENPVERENFRKQFAERRFRE